MIKQTLDTSHRTDTFFNLDLIVIPSLATYDTGNDGTTCLFCTFWFQIMDN